MRHWRTAPAAIFVALSATGCAVPNLFAAAGSALDQPQVAGATRPGSGADHATFDATTAVWHPGTTDAVNAAVVRSAATTVEEFGINPRPNVPEIVANVLKSKPAKVAADSADAADVEFAIRDESGRAATDIIEPVHRFQTIAVTWPISDSAPSLQVRVRSDRGVWGQWFTLVDDGADLDPGQQSMSGVRAGSDTVFVGESTAFQLATVGPVDKAVKTTHAKVVTIGTAAGRPVASLDDALSINNAAFIPGHASPATAVMGAVMAAQVEAPKIVTRAEWGAANPRCSWPAAGSVTNVVVHHTAGSNAYNTQAEAMQHIRNDQAYHQKTRGWCDIGYNFIVDKWGNIYEGAAGSMTKPIIGSHTAGFNTGSVGISMLGNYDAIAPNDAMVSSIGRLAAWRLSPYGINPSGQVSLVVHGKNTKGFPVGSTITTSAIAAHRDIGATACPGEAGYKQMDAIRWVAGQATAGALPSTGTAAPAPAATPDPAATPAPTPSPTRTWLSINEMKALQQALNRRFPSYSKLTIDGDLGPATKAVLKEFQRRVGIPQTGMPDAATKAELAKHKITW